MSLELRASGAIRAAIEAGDHNLAANHSDADLESELRRICHQNQIDWDEFNTSERRRLLDGASARLQECY